MIHPDINSYQHTLTAHTFFTYPATKTSNTHENMTTPTSPRYTHVYKHHPISRLGTGYRPQRPAESDWLKTIPRASWWLNFGPETPWRGFQKGCWKRTLVWKGLRPFFERMRPWMCQMRGVREFTPARYRFTLLLVGDGVCFVIVSEMNFVA